MVKNSVEKKELQSGVNSDRGYTNHKNLLNRVKSLHQQRIRALQKEMVTISLQNQGKHNINSILDEIKKLRKLLKYTSAKDHCF